MRKKSNLIIISLLVILGLILLILIIRYFSPKHLDDLHPSIPCDEELIRKTDYLSVIPKYDSMDISENKEWCSYIKSLNKSLILHGVYHSFNEFDIVRDSEYISEGIEIFTDCFNVSPSEFKAPQLALSKDNKKLLKEMGFKVNTKFTQLFHKVYHCNDSGLFPNLVSDLV